METVFVHRPVLCQETMTGLQVRPGGCYIDCTVGEGGHAEGILEASSPNGRLLGIDADPEALEVAKERLTRFGSRVTLVNDNFVKLSEIATRHRFLPADGVLFDLGLSSLQLERSERGFSFQREGPLDMRFNPARQRTKALDLVNGLSERELAEILSQFGEERFARRIARAIVRNRPLATTKQLAAVAARAVGRRGRIHPATKTFQALRIAVNDELQALETALPQAVDCLASGGRLAVISFHSLEDRMVKEYFRQEASHCICPSEAPVCTCQHEATLAIATKRVLRPSPEEIERSPRSRSAKLRIAYRL